MKVSDLAKEFKTTTDHVLEKLKSLRLKAKDGDQELSKAVLIVLKSELIKDMKEDSRKKVQPRPARRRSVDKEVKEKEETEHVAVPEEQEVPVAPAARLSKLEKNKEQIPELEKPVEEAVEPAAPAPHPEVVEKVKPGKTEVPGKKTAEEISKKEEEEKRGKAKFKKGKKQKKPGAELYTGSLDFKVGQDAQKFKKWKNESKSRTKSSIEPFISLKPFNKKKKRVNNVPESAAVVKETVLPQQKSENELRPLELKVPITVKDFANVIDQKVSVVLQALMQLKIFANINQALDEDVVIELAKRFGFEYVKIKSQEEQIVEDHKEEGDDSSKLTPRDPVVTFMGHVDHGKTSLLDRIRKSKVADQEHGGITQHIGAYSVSLGKGRISFLDTPGHEAFTAMRARGAHITDIVVLVVAADEGIMPQTQEAIDHAQAAGVPIVVALNKMDRPGANPDNVKKQLADRGLTPEDWGGQTIVVPVSAATGQGVDQLLEMLLLESEMLELRANKDKKASGIIVEANLSQGRGAVSTVIVQSGTLKLNDYVVVGINYGKVKAMFDDRGHRLTFAGPSTPVEILGLDGVPEAGSNFYVVDDEQIARQIVEKRRQNLKGEHLFHRITLEDLYSKIKEGFVKELNVILKADVQGSLEALRDSLAKIPSEEVKVKFIHMGVGDVNASDIILAVASNAIIIAFHVGIGPRAAVELEKQPVDVRQYRIIYDAVDDVKKSLAGLLAPKIKRTFLARVEVRQVFNLSRAGMVAGCFVLKGKIKRKDKIEVVRNGNIVYKGAVASLKRFKDDVREVGEGYECGLTLDHYSDLQAGDMIEAYYEEEIARSI
ncbi:MAG: translation initiation factor IF-2 [Candidatus Omnitrophota bacterium]